MDVERLQVKTFMDIINQSQKTLVFCATQTHDHFKGEEWDGEPDDPENCKNCGQSPCICPPEPCRKCGQLPCVCQDGDTEPWPECGNLPCVCEKPPKGITRVKLADNKVRELDATVKTSFYDPSGKPISAKEFIKQLFGDLPSFFKDEDSLRKIWSRPQTRKSFLTELSEKGYTRYQLEELSKLVHGQESDLFGVLLYIAYSKSMLPRQERADRARENFSPYSEGERQFLDFVLNQYTQSVVLELDDEKLPELIQIKYHTLSNAKEQLKEQLGDIASIRKTFIEFQEHLYEGGVA